MFVHDSQLRHVLPPEAYFHPDHLKVEKDRLLDPAWHFVASSDDFKKDGDFLSLSLLERPLLLRRHEGEVHAYLNVCSHRHCLITSKPSGNLPTIRCQYHGWEYQCDGRTGKIPEASSFRPFDRENSRLKKYRTDRCGNLIFVCLADQGPSLRQQLGEVYDRIERSYASPFRQVWNWDTDYPANWKACIENLLESYHIPCLHPKTFGDMPQEQNIQHVMKEGWTSFQTNEMDRWVEKGIRRTTSILGLPYTGHYTQYLVYPNLVFITLDTFSLAKMVVPTSPRTSRAVIRVFSPYGPRRGIIPWVSSRINAFVARDGSRKILHEDASIFPAAQQGLEASPFPGVIGRREERVFAFQDWIRRNTSSPDHSRNSLPVIGNGDQSRP
ncbi:MAG: aromatic ring-hydroxylating oxygenase subunit alpha [Gemmataceae bacterium]